MVLSAVVLYIITTTNLNAEWELSLWYFFKKWTLEIACNQVALCVCGVCVCVCVLQMIYYDELLLPPSEGLLLMKTRCLKGATISMLYVRNSRNNVQDRPLRGTLSEGIQQTSLTKSITLHSTKHSINASLINILCGHYPSQMLITLKNTCLHVTLFLLFLTVNTSPYLMLETR